ncbi:MAG: hypothetical protein Q8Q59_14475 [Luteolibacter sp.]|nr:hypothetical protein [Luteolibacter sp.]
MHTNPDFHHLNIRDIDRAMADAHSAVVPLICHEEDCFVEGSELHALTVEILVDRATPTHPHNRQAS